jgi:hypothetical protein
MFSDQQKHNVAIGQEGSIFFQSIGLSFLVARIF